MSPEALSRKYPSFEAWRAAQSRPETDSGFMDTVSALALNLVGRDNEYHLPNGKLGLLEIHSQQANQRMHSFLEGIVDASTQLSGIILDHINKGLYAEELTTPMDDYEFWEPKVELFQEEGVSLRKGSREQEIEQLNNTAKIGNELISILEPEEDEQIYIDRQVLLYEPTNPNVNPTLPYAAIKPSDYKFKTPALIRLKLGRSSSPYDIKINCFPITYARYKGFRHLNGAAPELAQESIMTRINRHGLGMSREERADIIQEGKRNYKRDYLKIALVDRETQKPVAGLQGNVCNKQDEEREDKVASGFQLHDAMNTPATKDQSHFLVLKRILTTDGQAETYNPAIQLAKDLLEIKASAKGRSPASSRHRNRPQGVLSTAK